MQTYELTMATAVLRGAQCRCPACGEGGLFRKFLKVADDMPAYVVMSIVGHIVVGLLLWTETEFAPSIWLHVALWFPLTIALSLALLQPVKGTIVAMQRALRMHGFGPRRWRGPLLRAS